MTVRLNRGSSLKMVLAILRTFITHTGTTSTKIHIEQGNCYFLTPWNVILREKLTGPRIVKKFPALYGTQRFSMCVWVCVLLCVLLSYITLVARLLARSPATGHFDTGFSRFPCVYKQTLRWFPTFQVATACFSCSPPNLKFLRSLFHIYVHAL